MWEPPDLSVGVYCAMPQDYLSDTPYCTRWGRLCLNMTNLVRYPLPFSEPFPLGALGEHAKWRCDTPPPHRRGISAIWKKVLRDMGGVSRFGPLSP